MKTNNLIKISLLAIILSACTSSQVTFNNNKAYHTKIKTAFVQIKDVKLGSYLKGVGDSLVADLIRNKVTVKLLETDILSLDSENDIQKEIKDFDSQVVILLERVDSKMTLAKTETIYDGGTYLMSIILPDTNKIIWKASFSTKYEQGGLGKVQASVKKTLKQIEDELKKDELL